MTGWACPARGGPTSRQLTQQHKVIDRDARETLSQEMGHGREQITAVYLVVIFINTNTYINVAS